jgi:uncharacterized protein YjdB
MMKRNILFWTAAAALIAAVSCTNKSEEVMAVRLDQNNIELVKGESCQLNARVVPDQEATFTWFSQDEDYVTVDQNGLVTAVGLKRAASDSDQITPVSVYVKYQNGADECLVTVLPLETSKVEIVYGEDILKIDPSQSVKLEAKCYPENADLSDITWSTDYAAVATVDSETGVVTGVTSGFALIRASFNDYVYDEIRVQVNLVQATSAAVEPSELTLEVGEKKQLKARLEPFNATDKPVWTSENPNVASIDGETGIVTAKSVGTARIKVQAGKASAYCTVTVK